jgi:hypothetical protein
MKVTSIPFRADRYSLGNQRICGGLVTVRQFRHNLKQTRGIPPVYKLYKSYQLVTVKGADEIAALQEAGMVSSERIEVLSEMRETFPLSERRLIIDVLDSPNQVIIEVQSSQLYSGFIRLSNHVSSLVIDLPLPPVFVCVDRQHGKAIPFQPKPILRVRVANILQERK